MFSSAFFISAIDWLLAAEFLVSAVLLLRGFWRGRHFSHLLTALFVFGLALVYISIELFGLTSNIVAPIFRPLLLLTVAMMISRAFTDQAGPRP